jgi:hypothetical protein
VPPASTHAAGPCLSLQKQHRLWPLQERNYNAHFGIIVPFARSINPITKTNWGETGVEPDKQVPVHQAFHVAHLQALESLRAKETEPRI